MEQEYFFDRVWCNDVTGIGECALNSAIARGDILPRHVHYQIGDLLCDERSPRSHLGKIDIFAMSIRCQAQRFVAVQGTIGNLFAPFRPVLRANPNSELRSLGFLQWQQVTRAYESFFSRNHAKTVKTLAS